MSEPNNVKKRKFGFEINPLHYRWVIFFLVLVCISLFSALCFNCKLSGYLSAFSSLLSIVLSAFAIFYTFFSGLLSQHVSATTEAEIQHINDLIASLSENIKTNAAFVSKATEISAEIDQVVDIINKFKLSTESPKPENPDKFVKDLNGVRKRFSEITNEFNATLHANN